MCQADTEPQCREPHLLDPEVEAKGVQDILEALTEEEKKLMPDPNMPIRHFRAEKGDTQLAINKLKDALQWRQDFEVHRLVDPKEDEIIEMLLKENETGKIYVRGYDCDGRATMYMRPTRENTGNELNNMKHLVYNLERAIACTKRTSGFDKVTLMIDYDGFRLRDSPPLSTSRFTLDILQKHYPERMHKAYVCNPPLAFRAFWSIIKPFLDPTTKEKIVFCHGEDGVAQVAKRFDLEQVEKCAGGQDGRYITPFDSRTYILETPFDHGVGEEQEATLEEGLVPTKASDATAATMRTSSTLSSTIDDSIRERSSSTSSLCSATSIGSGSF